MLVTARRNQRPREQGGAMMLVVSCTLCHGWIVVVADESDATSHFAIAAREEGAMPNRATTVTTDAYDERAFGLTGACRGSFGARPNCSPAIDARAKAGR